MRLNNNKKQRHAWGHLAMLENDIYKDIHGDITTTKTKSPCKFCSQIFYVHSQVIVFWNWGYNNILCRPQYS